MGIASRDPCRHQRTNNAAENANRKTRMHAVEPSYNEQEANEQASAQAITLSAAELRLRRRHTEQAHQETTRNVRDKPENRSNTKGTVTRFGRKSHLQSSRGAVAQAAHGAVQLAEDAGLEVQQLCAHRETTMRRRKHGGRPSGRNANSGSNRMQTSTCSCRQDDNPLADRKVINWL